METFDLSDIEFTSWDGRWPEREGQFEPCILCGRPVRTDKAHFRIGLADGGITAFTKATDEEEAELMRTDDGYMGWHPIGTGCKRKLPRGFAKKWED